MHPLQVALHEGFRDAEVTVTVAGVKVYHQKGVTTDLSISRADAVDVKAPAQALVAVAVEPGGRRGSITVDTRSFPFLAVSVVNGQVVFQPSREMFRYL